MLALGTAAMGATTKAQPFARAIAVEGDVLVQKGGAGEWMDLDDGGTLDKKDVIQTGQASRVDISYDKELENVLRVTQNSTVTLKDNGEIDMPKGKILAKLDNLKPGSQFNCRTPSAICGVRGSGFGVDTDGPMTKAYAYDHNCYVTSLDPAGNPVGDTMTLKEGYKCVIKEGQPPEKPEIMDNSDSQEFEDFVDEIDALINSVHPETDIIPTISPSGSR